MMEDKLRMLIVEARFYPDIADEMLAGASEALKAFGRGIRCRQRAGRVRTAGGRRLGHEAAHRPAGVRYDGYVALGCVIRGETTHYDYVCGESARGLMDLSIGKHLPIGYGVLTVEDEDQAWARASAGEGDKGGFAARACLDMIALKRRLFGQIR
jgi:6,7-dimethyl-8-ribityllumazine synthase